MLSAAWSPRRMWSPTTTVSHAVNAALTPCRRDNTAAEGVDQPPSCLSIGKGLLDEHPAVSHLVGQVKSSPHLRLEVGTFQACLHPSPVFSVWRSLLCTCATELSLRRRRAQML
eukprot:4874894-Pyramimonas_sp.AAC.1